MKSTFLVLILRRVEYVLLALVAFIPTIFLSMGTTNADTKLYLTSSPWKLLKQAQYAWDPSQFGGYVPHQAVGYLWPSGPFYLLLHHLQIPPWLIQRLWVGGLFFLAGIGVYKCAKHLGLQRSGSFVAALAYQVTPFVLAYQSRTSVLLLPWAGLGWICFITLLGIDKRGWRYPALIALIVFSVGGINATALIMIAPAPALFIVNAVFEHRHRFKSACALVGQIGVLCIGVSLWWIAMIAIQGRYGSRVLSYSETLESVSSTSTSVEVLRGLGYWLNYVVSPSGSTTTTAVRYMTSPLTIFLSLLIPALGILGIALTRLTVRRVASWLVLVGGVMAIGVYPLSSASPLMSPLANNPTSFLALALRSSTRAYPVLLLGIAIGVGALIQKICLSSVFLNQPIFQFGIVSAVSLLVLGSMPSLWTTGTTDSSLARRQSAPAAWQKAGSIIDKTSGSSSRVLQLPGQEFGAYKWGNTVDPALPTVTETPLITRDLLPLGEPQVMDLAFGLDDAAQNATLNARALSTAAKKLGVSSLFVPLDIDTSRYLTAEPTSFLDRLEISGMTTISDGNSSTSVGKIAESSVARTTDQMVILSGSGSGLINAARYGLVNDSLLRYSADMTAQGLSRVLETSPLILTDSNRIQTRHWRSSIDTLGRAQDGSETNDEFIAVGSDQRLPIFETQDSQTNSLAIQIGGVTATATSYGTPLSYWPEARAFFAVDGDPLTAWTAGAYADPYGATLHLKAKEPLTQLRLLQPQGNLNRWLNLVVISLDGKTWSDLKLTSESRTVGQVVTLAYPSREVRISLIGLEWVKGTDQQSLDGVGFSEVLANQPFTTEVVRLPTDAVNAASVTTPISVVLSREQASPQRWWRSDPELSINRSFQLSSRQNYNLEVTASLHADAPEQLTAEILGVTTTASQHTHGSLQNAGWFATDDDLGTSWRSRVGYTTSSSISFDVRAATPRLTLTQCSLPECNTITGVAISDGTNTVNAALADSGNSQEIDTSVLGLGRWTITATKATGRVFRDSRFDKLMLYPLEIFEITGAGITPLVPRVPDKPIPVQITIDNSAVQVIATLAGTASKPVVSVRPEDELSLQAGGHTVTTDSYNTSPISINNIAFINKQKAPVATVTKLALKGSPTQRTTVLPASSTPQWFVFGEGFSSGWNASIDNGQSLDHIRADGGFNAWFIAPHETPAKVTLTFAPQRTARLAQLITLLTVLFCLFLVWRKKVPFVNDAQIDSPLQEQQTMSLRARIVALILCALVAELVSTRPSWSSLLALGIVLLIVPWRPLVIAIAAALPIYRIWGAYTKITESDFAPRFDWPSVTASSHYLLLNSLIIFAVLVTLTTHRHPSN